LPPKARHTASMIAGVVVSSSATRSMPSPRPRLMFSDQRAGGDRFALRAGVHGYGVEEASLVSVKPSQRSPAAQHASVAVNPARDLRQSSGP